MMKDLRKGVFSETMSTKNVDVFRRNLQKSYIERVGSLLNDKASKNTDIHSIIRGELTVLKYQVNTASKRAINTISKYHYKDCLARINEFLNPKK